MTYTVRARAFAAAHSGRRGKIGDGHRPPLQRRDSGFASRKDALHSGHAAVEWYGENRVLLLAHGLVKAGIDLKRVTADEVSVSGKIIGLRLPPPQIMDAILTTKTAR
jgi:hypothetical protein